MRFSRIDIVRFERTPDPAMTNKALIVWCDGTLTGDGAADLQIRAANVLRRYRDEGLHATSSPRSITLHLRRLGPQDPGFARRLGFEYRDAADFARPESPATTSQ